VFPEKCDDIEKVTAMAYKFTLVLSREITEEESAILREADAVCADAVFGPDTLPANADVSVTKMDVDDTSSPTLAEAIQSALDAVKKVPDLSVPGLTVPVQPAGPLDDEKPAVITGEKPEVVAEEKPEAAAEEKTGARKANGKKPAARKPAVEKASANRSPQDNYDFADQQLTISQQEKFPYEFEVSGLSFVAHAGVFTPKYFPGVEMYNRWLRPGPEADVLEIGTGTGVVAVFAALAGARRVVATDVNPAAVANARANVAKHGLEGRVDVRHGDVFDPIRPDERFDLVFWSFPWLWVEPDVQLTDLQKACVDPGYGAARRYITQGTRLLAPGGRLTLGISTAVVRYDLIQEIAAEAGLDARIVERDEIAEPLPTSIPLELVEFVAGGDRRRETLT
jgi:methylase of polypeptide subunit release factors